VDVDYFMDNFTKILNKKLKGVNLSQLSRDLDIPSTLLFEWKQAKRLLSFKNLHHVKKLANYFGMSVDELLFGTSGPDLITSVMFEDNKKKYRIKLRD
jgi:hypothetical protein